MSLKGYQWLNDKGEVAMSFYFKDLTLYLWQDVSGSDYDDFMAYLEEHKEEVRHIKDNGYKIIR